MKSARYDSHLEKHCEVINLITARITPALHNVEHNAFLNMNVIILQNKRIYSARLGKQPCENIN